MGNKFIRAAFAGLLLGFVAATAAAEFNVSVSYFHETLAPHGRWVASSSYGDVWVPGGVAAGWSPYVDGEWQWTDYGWTWASSDPWGDIAYHYGTWVYSPPYGWVWVPGTVWSPAWVTWAYTDDYIGWAPVPVSFALSAHGYAGPAVVAARTSYVFVPARQFTGVRVASVRVPVAQVPTIYARAHRATAFPVTGGIVHNTGLPVARVEKVTGRKVEVVRAEPERLRVAPVPQGKSASYRVVAPKSERAAAIRPQEHGSAKPSHSAEAAPSGQEKKAPAHSATTAARPAPAPPPPQACGVACGERAPGEAEEGVRSGPVERPCGTRPRGQAQTRAGPAAGSRGACGAPGGRWTLRGGSAPCRRTEAGVAESGAEGAARESARQASAERQPARQGRPGTAEELERTERGQS